MLRKIINQYLDSCERTEHHFHLKMYTSPVSLNKIMWDCWYAAARARCTSSPWVSPPRLHTRCLVFVQEGFQNDVTC